MSEAAVLTAIASLRERGSWRAVEGAALKAAHAEVMTAQQKRLYDTTGWVRELLIPAVEHKTQQTVPVDERK